MKKWSPWILTAVFTLWILVSLRPAPDTAGFQLEEFGRLPVLVSGRVQPFDSVARNTLLSIHGTQTVRPPANDPAAKGEKILSAREWLLEVMTRPEDADKRKIFRVENIDLRNLLDAREGRLGQLSLNDLTPKLDEIRKQAEHIEETKKEVQLRNGYEKDLMHLFESLILYRRLKNSLQPEENSGDFVGELMRYRESIPAALVAWKKRQAGQDYNEQDLQSIAAYLNRFEMMSRYAYPLIIPPSKPSQDRDAWSNMGTSLIESFASGEFHPATGYFATMATASRNARPADFNRALGEYRQWLAGQGLIPELNKGRREFFFNQFEPFYKSMLIYICALLLGCGFWLNFSEPVRRSAFLLIVLAFVIHTAGLCFRMFLEGRPPVTNLYSSAIFVGWGAVVLGIILELIYRDGIGIVVAGTLGFITEIIAHHLSLSGDTMIMLQAVLDTNIWLATHVVVINIGYASTFLAGFLAIVYILRGVFTKSLTTPVAQSLTRMVYGIVCFATLFTFVGTILGGIWADQSWGRFWGWDPKENGALLIVLLNAAILHARWGGMVKERGLMAMAVAGNIVTAWSWFGVNMLGVGLHSYGFMDGAFRWLLAFVVSQVALIALAALPPNYWMSFKNQARPARQPASGVGGQRGAAPASA